MFTRTSLTFSKTSLRCISSSSSVRALQHTPVAATKTTIPHVSETEKAWCDVYGVDYKKQIAESLHECPAAAEKPNYHKSDTACNTQSKGKTDV